MTTRAELEDRVATMRRLLEVRTELRNRRVARWATDPVRWVQDVLPDVTLAPYQQRLLRALVEHRDVTARAPREAGKTMPAALAVLYFATTWDMQGFDWKIPITAGGWNQLRQYTMPEIHKWAHRMNWDVLGIGPWRKDRELFTFEVQGQYGRAFAINSDDPNKIEGAHAEHMFILMDEAKAVPDGSFVSIEGFTMSDGDYYRLAISVPGAPAGWFYDLHGRRQGYDSWHAIHVTKADAIAAGRMSEQRAAQLAEAWGVDSQPYRTHVLAEFAGESDGVIPLAWIEQAMARWRELDLDECRPEVVSADVASDGPDQSVIGLRWRDHLYRIDVVHPAPNETLDEYITPRTVTNSTVIVDSIGVGDGVLRNLRKHPTLNVRGFVASKATKRRDRSGEFRFANVRSAAWWNLRELLDPQNLEPITLPPDDQLLGDLAAPTWREAAGGKIQVESKDDIRKRLGRSTDVGDVAVQAFWVNQKLVNLTGAARALDDPDLHDTSWIANI